LGCRLYPVIYDETKGIIVDNIYPAGGNLNEKKIEKKGKKVIKLLEKIGTEAKRRRSAWSFPTVLNKSYNRP
jgi:hypothetical protein